ncbi:Flagellar biosynthetic protein FlhB [Phaeobacter sp. CECT 5382]|uniref:flagellar type III secretion system protein FlhB n=1 Tax=Rhodobacterales TaxID=204455 RepID=UPI0006DB976E|nr:flagellar type III secretion system protein FlhB [Phaeobacter sp. CECT 5382]CUH86611.1 Flagellar biosynthetic protein FlhB [Phaeobacter sp. CECT 5382]
MSQDDDSDKSFEPTAEKLRKAREKGEVAKSTDLSVAAAYLGLVLAIYGVGASAVGGTGTVLMSFIDQADRLSVQLFSGNGTPVVGGMIGAIVRPLIPFFMIPAALVLLSILGQKALVFAPTKLEPKLSRLSIISNAKNKFGRAGIFEFLKSTFKLILYSICLGVYLNLRLPMLVSSAGSDAFSVIKMMSVLGMEFLVLAVLISVPIGVVDALFQHAEHNRKNMMSRKEIQDESKDAEGDPHMKAKRRQKAQMIALGQMMGAVPEASVVIVNPTHYAVALKWEGGAGTAPICVAKGVDEVAARIREVANENAVPIHSDPPTARALYAAIGIGDEVEEEYYAPVAAAIRFAEEMRQRAKGGIR